MLALFTAVLMTAAPAKNAKPEPAPPGARELGAQGTKVLGVDRAVGLHTYSVTVEPDGGGELTVSGSSVAIPFGFSYTGEDTVGVNPGAVPRLGFDYFIRDNVSIGGTIGYYSVSGETDTGGGSTDLPNISGHAIHLRAGYVLPIWGVYFWPRGGLQYVFSHTEIDAIDYDLTWSALDLTAEPVFFLPLGSSGFGVLAGAVFDFALAGTFRQEDGGNTVEGDTQLSNIGLVAGLIGYW